jgi:hypothetical protein
VSRELVPGRIPSFVLAPPECCRSPPKISYSVLQHFSKENMILSLAEIQRVLRRGGRSLIQMPNRRASRSLLVLAHRGFTEGSEFDVRYYYIGELLQLFTQHIGRSDWRVDCFLGLNVHADDRKFARRSRRLDHRHRRGASSGQRNVTLSAPLCRQRLGELRQWVSMNFGFGLDERSRWRQRCTTNCFPS